jgi:hypothetical protein
LSATVKLVLSGVPSWIEALAKAVTVGEVFAGATGGLLLTGSVAAVPPPPQAVRTNTNESMHGTNRTFMIDSLGSLLRGSSGACTVPCGATGLQAVELFGGEQRLELSSMAFFHLTPRLGVRLHQGMNLAGAAGVEAQVALQFDGSGHRRRAFGTLAPTVQLRELPCSRATKDQRWSVCGGDLHSCRCLPP